MVTILKMMMMMMVANPHGDTATTKTRHTDPPHKTTTTSPQNTYPSSPQRCRQQHAPLTLTRSRAPVTPMILSRYPKQGRGGGTRYHDTTLCPYLDIVISRSRVLGHCKSAKHMRRLGPDSIPIAFPHQEWHRLFPHPPAQHRRNIQKMNSNDSVRVQMLSV